MVKIRVGRGAGGSSSATATATATAAAVIVVPLLLVSTCTIMIFLCSASSSSSLSSSLSWLATVISSSWLRCPAALDYYLLEQLRHLARQAQAYFLVPDLDFRAGNGDSCSSIENNQGMDKVKEAVAKSLEKSKSVVEDSAKTAAKIASQTVHNTAEKMKKTLIIDSSHSNHHQAGPAAGPQPQGWWWSAERNYIDQRERTD